LLEHVNQGAGDIPEHAGGTDNMNKILICKSQKDTPERSQHKAENNIYFVSFKSWATQNFITIKSSWNTND
jgi:hypothetical protein